MQTRIALVVFVGVVAISAVSFHEIHAQVDRPIFMFEDNTVRDPEHFAKEFAPLAQDSVKVYGGHYLAGGSGISIDGDPPKGRVVLVQWDSMDQLLKWRHSPEYTHARSVGEKYGSFRIIAIEGTPQ